MAGKDQRALMIEPHVSAGRVKFARTAYAKQMEFKGAVYNHALSQITGFRLFDRKASKRADDLADAFMYAVLTLPGRRPSRSLGQAEAGFMKFFSGTGDPDFTRLSIGGPAGGPLTRLSPCCVTGGLAARA